MDVDWKEVSIGELGKIVTGHTPSRKEAKHFGGKYTWIKPTDVIKGRRYVIKTEENYSDVAFKKYKESLLPPLSTCVVTIGTVGEKICLTKEPSFTNQAINAIIPKTDKYESMFVYYMLKYNLPRVAQRNSGTASGRHNVSKSNFSSINVKAPSYPIQKKISNILSSFDDLIEVNEKRIELLKEIPELLFTEWFVNFRFPICESIATSETSTENKQSEPHRWSKKKIADFARIYRGKAYSSSNLSEDEGLPFATLKSITRDGGFRIDGLKRFLGIVNENCVAQPKDMLLALTDVTQERRVVGRAARLPMIGLERFVYSMDLLKLLPLNDYDNAFLYGLARYSEMPSKLKECANGVNVLHLSQKHVENFEFTLPPDWLRKSYSQNIEPIYDLIDILTEKTLILIHLRDYLLSIIFSGKLDDALEDMNA